MNLIAYSDSEDSDGDAPPAPKLAAKPAPKLAFQKVVDRSNPGKIKLNLPAGSRPGVEKDDADAEGPPAKKARTGAGAFSGFNSMLPAPKKPNASIASDGPASGKKGLGKGVGSGVSLRTGAEPAFAREQRITEADEYDENGNPVKKQPLKTDDFRALFNLPAPKSEQEESPKPLPVQEEEEEVKQPVPKPKRAKPKFMPLSVARDKKKKPLVPKTPAPIAGAGKISGNDAIAAPSNTDSKAPAKPKVSLFSISQEAEAPAKSQPSDTYQPLLYGTQDDDQPSMPDEAFETSAGQRPRATGAPTASNDLTSIASELNLSAAEKRQLFGRKGQGPDLSSANIVEFNTDSEYAHNEFLRQQGEQVQHNALRSISGTGKNSLRSLIGTATTQKDALEDHFAQSRRNKREAGNKYGF
jgi:hypothetical protein